MEKEIEIELDVVNQVMDAIKEVDEKDNNPDYYKNLLSCQLHVSECFSCPLKVKYRREEYDKPKKKEPNSAFDIGNAIESFLYYKLRYGSEDDKWNWKRHFPCFIPIRPPLGGIRGSVDIAFQKGNRIVPIEVKTTSSKYLEDFCQNANIKGQLLSYMHGVGASTGIIKAYSKNGHYMRTQEVSIMEEITIKKMNYLIQDWLKFYFDKWMEKDFTGLTPLFDWECNHCEFLDKCPEYQNQKA
jgi:hypothetical protein